MSYINNRAFPCRVHYRAARAGMVTNPGQTHWHIEINFLSHQQRRWQEEKKSIDKGTLSVAPSFMEPHPHVELPISNFLLVTSY